MILRTQKGNSQYFFVIYFFSSGLFLVVLVVFETEKELKPGSWKFAIFTWCGIIASWPRTSCVETKYIGVETLLL